MALAMTILVLEPRWHLGVLAVAAYVTGFSIALWLLLGPVQEDTDMANTFERRSQ